MADDTEEFASCPHRQRQPEGPAAGSAPCTVVGLAAADLFDFVGSVVWAAWKALSAGSSASIAPDSVVAPHSTAAGSDSTVAAVGSEQLPVPVSGKFAGSVDELEHSRHLKLIESIIRPFV